MWVNAPILAQHVILQAADPTMPCRTRAPCVQAIAERDISPDTSGGRLAYPLLTRDREAQWLHESVERATVGCRYSAAVHPPCGPVQRRARS